MKFNEKIVRLRKIRGITQDELASAVGVSRQAVYKWECGQSYPEASKLVELKALFGISIDDLLDESYEIAMPEKKKRKKISRAKAEKIMREVEESLKSESEPEEVAPTVVEVEAEPVAKSVTLTEEAEAIVEAVEEETLPVAEPEAAEDEETPVAEEETVAAEEEAPAEEQKAPERRRGFFSRLFGRK